MQTDQILQKTMFLLVFATTKKNVIVSVIRKLACDFDESRANQLAPQFVSLLDEEVSLTERTFFEHIDHHFGN